MAQTVLAPIDTNERAGYQLNFPIAAAVHVYPGTIGALDANGNLTYATDTAGLEVIGRIEGDVDNSAGAAGALFCDVRRSAFIWVNSATHPLAAVNVGDMCFVQDEQTVCTAAGSVNQVKAGIFLGLDPDTGGAIVDTRTGFTTPSADTLTALPFTTPTAAEVGNFRAAVVAILKAQGLII
jgi:hypothetical protein